ncbi:LysM peptidoglycan-binding domain-containing protein [Burkholderia stagnalis]|nr:LysM peptidoglycan-binding domain-containing protein [Burkholderia stagnalis]RQX97351.1 LysM peptidoglycan-binding domain-containing protein [Burkholderia stagnalis]RQY11952.1 LysM peptidoglycan-binding domain-containing protein [Burkholderia stagnalis]RQY28306.1 LysM peptidoglycan-binding domain-containing protein [Burkholderia stagnalis]
MRGSMFGTTTKRFVAASIAALLAACGSAPVGPGFYRVESGDTLYKIARANRQSVQNIARWNQLSNPDAIEVGQVLRVAPPAGTTTAAATTAPSGVGTGSAGRSRPAPSAPAESAVKPASNIALIWPSAGNVVRTFDGGKSKGIDIANAAGTPVIAAAPGVVVYAGNGLRGYGNLIILKHNADYLTAYAHNRALLVKEGQSVTQGQTIAEMGNTDSDRVALHFELRYGGRSIDPARYLPAR